LGRDRSDSCAIAPPPTPQLRRAPVCRRRRLWLAGAGYALFITTLAVGNGFVAPERGVRLNMLGHDFLPFYTAGTLVREGRHRELYHLDAIRAAEHRIADMVDLPLGDAVGPFWNPPFYALPFAPLSALPFRAAWVVWMTLNVAALLAAIALLCHMTARLDIVSRRPARPEAWSLARAEVHTWGLVLLLTLFSVPCILALTHGQNTAISLLLLTCAVTAWRADCGFVAGAVVSLLAYKPQLAALVALVMAIDLGPRALAGMLTTGAALALVTLVALPGSVADYLHGLPRILHFMQVGQPYMWERHATLRAFWRLLLQGRAAGEVAWTAQGLTAACSLALGAALLLAAVRARRSTERGSRDRLIAATVAVMPLVMPFYFDYDLLMLAVPAVLVAADRMPCGRWHLAAWCGLYVALTVNADLALLTRVNPAVPLLTAVAVPLLGRALRREAVEVSTGQADLPLRMAA
jgi:hypothetical protein